MKREDQGQEPQDFNRDAFDMLVWLRGGLPEACDFCGQAFTKQNYPTPEEAGEWACIECATRWHEQEVAQRKALDDAK